MAPVKKNTRSPYNPDSTLFKGLTRLLSGPIADYRRQNPRQLKRFQLDKYRFKSAAGLPFKKSSYSPFDNIYANTQANQARAERYIDFDQMEYTSIIASAMDIYADEMTSYTPLKPMLNIECPNEEIKGVIHHLAFEIMNGEFNFPFWARSYCKYGDLFMYLDIEDGEGIRHLIGIANTEVERLEGQDKTNPRYVQFQWNSAGLTLEEWQVAHFRIQGNDKHAPYGTSILDPVRRIWRQYDLLKNAMMAYRIVRAPERRVVYVDVGGIPDNEVEQYMQKIITEMKKNIVIDADSGQADIRYNPMSVDEDIYIATRGGNTGTRIDPLPGGTYTGDIDDVKFLRDELISGLKIPHSYLMKTEGGEEDKESLAQKDIMFAKVIQKLQKGFCAELEKLARIHLYALGYRGKDLLCFKLSLNNPSKIAELQELETWRTRFDTAAAATEGYVSRRWVAKKLLGFTDEEFLRNLREMWFDKKFDAEIAKLEAAAEGEEGMGDVDDIFDDAEEAAPDEGEAEDETLLAAPGKRYDEPYLTPGAKGKKYKQVASDKRRHGARRRSMRGKYADEMGRNTKRNVFKGKSGLDTFSRGIYEQYEASYKQIIDEEKNSESPIIEEGQVLRDNNDIKHLIESLDKSGLGRKDDET